MPKRIVLAGWVTCLALISALLMAVIYVPGSDPSRVYYGTDTRGFALLIGAALALVWPSGKLKEQASAKARMLLDSIGAISLLLLCHWAWASNEYDPSLYRGGLLGIALVTAIVVAAVAHPVSHLGRLLGIKPLRWIGARSYGLYLWHFPVITLTTPQVDTDGVHVTRTILQLLATVLLASLSFKYIEEPIRHGDSATGLQKSVQRFVDRRGGDGCLQLQRLCFLQVFSWVPSTCTWLLLMQRFRRHQVMRSQSQRQRRCRHFTERYPWLPRSPKPPSCKDPRAARRRPQPRLKPRRLKTRRSRLVLRMMLRNRRNLRTNPKKIRL